MDIYDVIQYIYNHPDVQVRQTISIGKLDLVISVTMAILDRG
jgi:hypothetical protein